MGFSAPPQELYTSVDPGRSVSVWVRCGGPVVLAGALMLYALVYVHWPRLAVQVDLQVYRFGAMRVRDGLDLYSIGLTGNSKELLFIYPPFAALAFCRSRSLPRFPPRHSGWCLCASWSSMWCGACWHRCELPSRMGCGPSRRCWWVWSPGWNRFGSRCSSDRSTLPSSPSWSPIC
ncbi:hypothetical protein I552_6525 [Mycobacterium xenopi 3993]|nr:hypothetical protein I552_6525 [Mycobacterium xenopi 3993]